jgi:transaldolase
MSIFFLFLDPRVYVRAGGVRGGGAGARALRGKAAIACAKQAYQIYREITTSDRFRRLAKAGAQPQRVLWASTSTKNPQERDVRYVEALIGPDTINTLPLKTLEAFRDHGDPTPRLEQGLDDVRATLRELGEIGIDLEAVGRQLEEEGEQKFNQQFDHLHTELARRLGEFAESRRQ